MGMEGMGAEEVKNGIDGNVKREDKKRSSLYLCYCGCWSWFGKN